MAGCDAGAPAFAGVEQCAGGVCGFEFAGADAGGAAGAAGAGG